MLGVSLAGLKGAAFKGCYSGRTGTETRNLARSIVDLTLVRPDQRRRVQLGDVLSTLAGPALGLPACHREAWGRDPSCYGM